MINSRLLNFIFIIGGGVLALYAQTGENPSTILMFIGIVFLFFGIYRTSKNIPSKSETRTEEENKDYVLDDDFDDKTDLKN